MPDYKDVYKNHPDQYDALVRAEDWQGMLIAALGDIRDLSGAEIIEVGAGTGRITRQLLEAGARHVVATELEDTMLALARESLAAYGDRVRFEVADARSLPLKTHTADLSIAGWVLGHFRSWMGNTWKKSVEEALAEMQRVTRPGGQIVVIETLGTGSEEPSAPSAGLAEYYDWLEAEHGFVRRTIRTDYQFDSVDDAARITGFFFGKEFSDRVGAQGWTRVPECTGIWTKQL